MLFHIWSNLVNCFNPHCQNRLFSNSLEANIYDAVTGHKGRGAFLDIDIKANTFICLYTGKKINKSKALALRNNEHTFVVHVSGDEYLDAANSKLSNKSRFIIINNACDPMKLRV